MSKQIVNIPEYMMVRHYQALTHIKSLDEVEQMIHTISVICEVSKEDILKWDIKSVRDVYNTINGIIGDTTQTFYPVIEWNGQMYGYRNMAKMSLGEYIDLDNLCKDIDKNLTSVLAILYRPLKNNKIKENKFILKSTYKAMKYEVENIFDYYDVDDYDSTIRKQQTSEYENFPLDVAMGGVGFFLDTAVMLSTNMEIYSLSNNLKEIMNKTLKMSKIKRRLLHTMAGFMYSTNLLKRRYFPSQEIKQ